jgi:predicted O-methyltransferase YrrM
MPSLTQRQMLDDVAIDVPSTLTAIEADTVALGFEMPSERQTGTLLRTLAASCPNRKLLELGTGTGLATAWLLDGMDKSSTLTTAGNDERLQLCVEDANIWLNNNSNNSFDLIFADAMPGKYENFELAWNMLSIGGTYIIDDMLPQNNWPKGHASKVQNFLAELDNRNDCRIAKMCWSSGIVLAVRTN